MHRTIHQKTQMTYGDYTRNLPTFKAKARGLCPWCSTWIIPGATLVRLEKAVEPESMDRRKNDRDGKHYFSDGRQISMQPRQYVHLDCYKKDLLFEAEFTEGCHYCGTRQQELTIDHIHPTSKGGRDTPNNITVACRSCNSRKGTKKYNEFINR